MLGILRASAASSAVLQTALPRVLDGDYLEDFGLGAVVEELDAVHRLGAGSGLRPGLLAASRARHRDALRRFGPVPGELSVVRLLEEESGRPLR